jgi:RHH-type proline utilization regulon transcriptional repressor/proline dehydrogenase/delta 1-pyrroline-5-carboxylate dehydrogenase
MVDSAAERVGFVQDVPGSLVFHERMNQTTVAPASATVAEDVLIDDAIVLARRLLVASHTDETRREVRRRGRLGALLADDRGRQLIFALTDEVLRVGDAQLAAERFAGVVARFPTRAVGRLDSVLLRVGALLAPRLPRLVMPLVVRRIKAETRGIVIPADDPAFRRHLRRRVDDGVSMNINPLGEAILSDAEADERMAAVLAKVARTDVDYVSVKVSAIVANLDVLAFDVSLDRICERLRTLYRHGSSADPRTFVNLDMEEYRDLELTLQSFMRVLDEPEFAGIDAGIVLQAYLPDSHDALERLGTWATRRRSEHGGRIKVRLVKGANLAMELVEAELHGWVPAPYPSKADVDASFKALTDSALRPEWADSLRIGLASHNLFDVAWALTVGAERGALDRIEFEMLEGMAPSQARAVHTVAGGLLMYAPVVASGDFEASIAYLTRRLDENTQPDNFLRSLFTLTPDSAEFDVERERFRSSVVRRHVIDRGRRRAPRAHAAGSGFDNEPDSDPTLVEVRAAFADAVADAPRPGVDRIDDTVRIDELVGEAARAHRRADQTTAGRHDRRHWLLRAADLMSSERADTLGLMAHCAVKTIHEGDPEVSEAIDFCRYYATEGSHRLDVAAEHGCAVAGRGVVVVVGPWNFPYAIPVGGVAAALAAGNSVILKPAPEVVAVGAWIADQFWRAGVPRDVLHLVICDDGPIGQHLVTHPDVDTVVLTGAYETARMFLEWRPDLRVLAETSGKDALVITPSADIDEAIADLVRSAFGHGGQKCSAASLGIVVAEVYDDPTFHRRLRDAVLSLRVGAATSLATMVGPLIAPPSDKLERGLTRLDPGESWLVEPRQLDTPGTEPGTSWTPGVRLGVRAGSWFHRTECFGPVLGLMRAADLDHAIELQNATAFGLTGGIHSLDDAEVERWLDRVEVGNAYVNRHITGAIVRRQPFGGWKRSSIGGGAKAGGPGYVAQFARIEDDADAEFDEATLLAAFTSAWREYYCADHDHSGLLAESNILRYFPLSRVSVRHADERSRSLATLRVAASAVGAALDESDPARETDLAFARRVAAMATPSDRVRLVTSLDDEARRVLHQADIVVDVAEPTADPMVELQHWAREQAISRTLHRHGRPVSVAGRRKASR